VDDGRTIAQSLARVRDARSAFAFIGWFAREWLTPLRDSDECTAEEVAAAEERLGLRLPASLAAFYRLLGWRRDLTSNQDSLITLNSLTVVDGVLVYRIEAQACASWGVRVSDLGLADPPAVFCEGYGDGRPWRPFLGSFSLAAVEMVLSEALFGPAGYHDNRALDDADIVRLEELCDRLPFPGYPAWWQPDIPQAVRWFGGPGVLLREDNRTWLWALAQNAAGLARVRDALPGIWQDTAANLRSTRLSTTAATNPKVSALQSTTTPEREPGSKLPDEGRPQSGRPPVAFPGPRMASRDNRKCGDGTPGGPSPACRRFSTRNSGDQGSNWMSGKRGDEPSSRWLSRLRRYLSKNARM
jgi:hypothetical protein